MITVNKLDKIIRGKTKSVTNTHIYDRKIVNNRGTSKSRSKDKERKQNDSKPKQQYEQNLTEVLRKTLTLLTRRTSSENVENEHPLKLAEAIYHHIKQLGLSEREKTYQTQRSLL
jgi:hypothetical protein